MDCIHCWMERSSWINGSALSMVMSLLVCEERRVLREEKSHRRVVDTDLSLRVWRRHGCGRKRDRASIWHDEG